MHDRSALECCVYIAADAVPRLAAGEVFAVGAASAAESVEVVSGWSPPELEFLSFFKARAWSAFRVGEVSLLEVLKTFSLEDGDDAAVFHSSILS